jgi:hypothetical protein
MKMQDAISTRGLAPHIFSGKEQAQAAREAAALRKRLQQVERLD